jgi:hypothetical protein
MEEMTWWVTFIEAHKNKSFVPRTGASLQHSQVGFGALREE